MPRKLKVYCGNLDGRNRAIVAAHNKKEAAAAYNVTLHSINLFVNETGNCEEIAVAMAEPGVVFYQLNDFRGGPWFKEPQKRDRRK